MSVIVVGVDGGATKTSAVVIEVVDDSSPSGRRVLGRAVGSSTNRNSVGNDAAVSTMSTVLNAALKEAGKEFQDVRVAVFALSGCDTAEDVEYWQKEGSKLMSGAKIVVENDAIAALCSGTGGKLAGIVVISGTGSIGFGVSPNGQTRFRAGGWGPLLGDAGNGYSIGAAALLAVARADDRRGPETPLTGLVLSHLGISAADGLLPWAYGDKAAEKSWDRIAALAPLVFRGAAEHSCPVCIEILEKAGEELCELAETVAKRLGAGADGQPPVTLVLAGSICADDSTYLAKAVAKRLARTLPSAAVCRPFMPPCEAAAQLAAILLQA